eukprot:3597155-Amphidinium_carterae.1
MGSDCGPYTQCFLVRQSVPVVARVGVQAPALCASSSQATAHLDCTWRSPQAVRRTHSGEHQALVSPRIVVSVLISLLLVVSGNGYRDGGHLAPSARAHGADGAGLCSANHTAAKPGTVAAWSVATGDDSSTSGDSDVGGADHRYETVRQARAVHRCELERLVRRDEELCCGEHPHPQGVDGASSSQRGRCVQHGADPGTVGGEPTTLLHVDYDMSRCVELIVQAMLAYLAFASKSKLCWWKCVVHFTH